MAYKKSKSRSRRKSRKTSRKPSKKKSRRRSRKPSKKKSRKTSRKNLYYVTIKKSTRDGKKLMAIFYDKQGNKVKTTHFGAKGYSDFTIHKDPARKQRYINRHRSRENWKDPTTPGALSLYIL